METEAYITINENGSLKLTKSKPSMKYNEVCMKLDLKIPDAMFSKPLIEAKIIVDESISPKPSPIETIINTKELIENSTGVKIDFSVKPFEEEIEEEEEICECGHHTNNHSYKMDTDDENLYCDDCGCKNFTPKNSKI